MLLLLLLWVRESIKTRLCSSEIWWIRRNVCTTQTHTTKREYRFHLIQTFGNYNCNILNRNFCSWNKIHKYGFVWKNVPPNFLWNQRGRNVRVERIQPSWNCLSLVWRKPYNLSICKYLLFTKHMNLSIYSFHSIENTECLFYPLN